MFSLLKCLLLLFPILSFAQTGPMLQGIEHQEGNSIRHLYNGKVLEEARMDLLKNAKSSIYLSAFSISPDENGKNIYNILCQKGKEGLDVRVILDHKNSKDLYDLTVNLKEKCNAFVISFRPGNRWFALHEKIFVVDGERFITGGSGYSKKYLYASPESHNEDSELRKIRTEGWYDSDYLLEGPAACSIHHQFRNNFILLAKQMADYNPDVWWYGVKNFIEIMPKYYGFGKFKNCVSSTVKGEMRAISIHNNPHKTDSKKRPLLKAHLAAMKQTVKGEEILLYSPYFVPGTAFVNELGLAAKRGVIVKVITNSLESTDEKKFAKKLFIGMMEALAPAIQQGVKIFLWNQNSTIHRKGGKFGKVMFYGSDNLDNRGQDYQAEDVVYTDAIDLVAKVKEDFERDLKLSIPLSYEYIAKVYAEASFLDKFVGKRLKKFL